MFSNYIVWGLIVFMFVILILITRFMLMKSKTVKDDRFVSPTPLDECLSRRVARGETPYR
jgi:hypothetical protein